MMQSTISYPGHKKQRTFQQPQPPPGVSEGGNWGSVKHCGDKTVRLCVFLCLFAGVCTRCGLRAYGCPQDEKDAYQVNGQIYDVHGNKIASARNTEFSPYRIV